MHDYYKASKRGIFLKNRYVFKPFWIFNISSRVVIFLDYKGIFKMFDQKDTGKIDSLKIPEILTELGTEFDEDDLDEALEDVQDG